MGLFMMLVKLEEDIIKLMDIDGIFKKNGKQEENKK